MHKLLVFLFLLVVSCASIQTRYTRTPQQMHILNSSVVALVQESMLTGNWRTYCSGTFIGRETILTAAHCVEPIEGSQQIFVRMYTDSGNHEFYVSSIDVDVDLALLKKVNNGEVLPRHPWIRVGRRAPAQGENVILIGHPLGLGWTLTAGVVSSADRHGWGYEIDPPLYIQHDASAYPGSSGGPLLNYNNELVGVLVQGHRLAEYLSMSVHTDTINEFL